MTSFFNPKLSVQTGPSVRVHCTAALGSTTELPPQTLMRETRCLGMLVESGIAVKRLRSLLIS
jgi:hypothetical protein